MFSITHTHTHKNRKEGEESRKKHAPTICSYKLIPFIGAMFGGASCQTTATTIVSNTALQLLLLSEYCYSYCPCVRFIRRLSDAEQWWIGVASSKETFSTQIVEQKHGDRVK